MKRAAVALLLALVTTLVVLALPFFIGPEGKPLCSGPWKMSYGKGPWSYVTCSATPWTPGIFWSEEDFVWWEYQTE